MLYFLFPALTECYIQCVMEISLKSHKTRVHPWTRAVPIDPSSKISSPWFLLNQDVWGLYFIWHRASGVLDEQSTCGFLPHATNTYTPETSSSSTSQQKVNIPDPFQIFKIYILFCHENDIAHLWNGVFQLFREFNVLCYLSTCLLQLLHRLCGFFSSHKYTLLRQVEYIYCSACCAFAAARTQYMDTSVVAT